jgi:hypothetical protein
LRISRPPPTTDFAPCVSAPLMKWNANRPAIRCAKKTAPRPPPREDV